MSIFAAQSLRVENAPQVIVALFWIEQARNWKADHGYLLKQVWLEGYHISLKNRYERSKILIAAQALCSGIGGRLGFEPAIWGGIATLPLGQGGDQRWCRQSLRPSVQ